MARIRTIKPDFFTSEDVVSLTPLARLLFIATWMEADREGRLIWRTKTLKLRYLPGENCSVEALADELVRQGLIILYEVDGQQFAEIPTFKKHQVINNREASSTLPARDAHASATRAPRDDDATFTPLVGKEGKEGKGKEDDDAGKEAREAREPAAAAAAEFSVGPETELMTGVLDAYQEIHGVRPPGGIQLIQLIQQRVTEYPKAADSAWWRTYFWHTSQDAFLAGQKKPGFKATLQYLLKPDVFARVIEAAQRQGASHG